jgi:hypothetical protein
VVAPQVSPLNTLGKGWPMLLSSAKYRRHNLRISLSVMQNLSERI